MKTSNRKNRIVFIRGEGTGFPLPARGGTFVEGSNSGRKKKIPMWSKWVLGFLLFLLLAGSFSATFVNLQWMMAEKGDTLPALN